MAAEIFQGADADKDAEEAMGQQGVDLQELEEVHNRLLAAAMEERQERGPGLGRETAETDADSAPDDEALLQEFLDKSASPSKGADGPAAHRAPEPRKALTIEHVTQALEIWRLAVERATEALVELSSSARTEAVRVISQDWGVTVC